MGLRFRDDVAQAFGDRGDVVAAWEIQHAGGAAQDADAHAFGDRVADRVRQLLIRRAVTVCTRRQLSRNSAVRRQKFMLTNASAPIAFTSASGSASRSASPR